MPKRYSDQERAYIQKRLKEVAADCIARYGIRHTTVDEIVKRANIPKGTFYLFYQSKELLLFDVILESHELVEQKMLTSLQQLDFTALTADQLTDTIWEGIKTASEMPILNVLHSDEIELLARKLPPEVVAAHLGHDDDMLKHVCSMFPVKEGFDSQTFSAAFRAIYFCTLHKQEIGDEFYENAMRMLIHGLVLQLLPES